MNNNQESMPNLDVKRVDEKIEELTQSVNNHPNPLTQKELDYYKRAREEALRRQSKVKPVSSLNNVQKNNFNPNLKPASNQDINNSQYMRNHSPENYQKTGISPYPVNVNNNQNQNVQPPVSEYARPITAEHKAEQDKIKHIEKQRYYDSRYADGKSNKSKSRNFELRQSEGSREMSQNYTYEEQRNFQEPRPKRRRSRWIIWLLYLLIGIAIGYLVPLLLLRLL